MSVYCCADIHGAYWFWEGVQKILKPEDTLYFLGDAIDRGADGWRILTELLNDPRIIYIKGNHEDMMLKAIGNITVEDLKEGELPWNDHMSTWWYNGAEPTYTAIINDEAYNVVSIIKELKRIPFCSIYKNKEGKRILLSHAGCDNIAAAEETNEFQFIWDRSHWLFASTWNGKDDELIVHGHTPIELMIEEQRWYGDTAPYKGHGAYWYGQGHKVCIDTGAVWDKEGVLLNLDTYEEIIIKDGGV